MAQLLEMASSRKRNPTPGCCCRLRWRPSTRTRLCWNASSRRWCQTHQMLHRSAESSLPRIASRQMRPFRTSPSVNSPSKHGESAPEESRRDSEFKDQEGLLFPRVSLWAETAYLISVRTGAIKGFTSKGTPRCCSFSRKVGKHLEIHVYRPVNRSTSSDALRAATTAYWSASTRNTAVGALPPTLL